MKIEKEKKVYEVIYDSKMVDITIIFAGSYEEAIKLGSRTGKKIKAIEELEV